MTGRLKVGVISDTHGLLRPAAVEALRGVDQIIHAGDIGSRAILEELRRIAPTTAVRGNVDRDCWASSLPDTATAELGQSIIYVIHDLLELAIDPHEAGYVAVISGHSHRPSREWRDGVLFFNPGSAGPRRFRLPVALGFLTIAGNAVAADIVELDR